MILVWTERHWAYIVLDGAVNNKQKKWTKNRHDPDDDYGEINADYRTDSWT